MIFGVTKATIPAVLKPSCLFSNYCSIMRSHANTFTLSREQKPRECSLSADAWSIKPGFLPLAVFHASEESKIDKKNLQKIIINLHFYDQSRDPNLGRKHSFLPLIGVAWFDFDALGNIFLPHRKFCDCRWMHTFFLLALFSLKKKKKLWFASLLKSSF